MALLDEGRLISGLMLSSSGAAMMPGISRPCGGMKAKSVFRDSKKSGNTLIVLLQLKEMLDARA